MTDPRPVQTLDWRAFLRLLSEHTPGATISADSLRATLADDVQVRPDRLGALFLHAADAGYIERVGYVRSTGERARGHVIVQWARTRKPVVPHPCEVGA